jgi:hypothetical protein
MQCPGEKLLNLDLIFTAPLLQNKNYLLDRRLIIQYIYYVHAQISMCEKKFIGARQLSEYASNNKCETTESMHQLSFSLAHTNHCNDMIIDENTNRQPLMRTLIIV